MDATILLLLLQDGVVNGVIYALIALSLVLVFTVTRVILIPQGEFVAYGALTLAGFEAGTVPGTVPLLLALGAAAFAADLVETRHALGARVLLRLALRDLALPALVAGLAVTLGPGKPGLALGIALTLAIVTPMGAYLHSVAFRPLEKASVLVLLVAAVGVHLALTGLGLVFFGAEGSRTPPLSDAMLPAGPLVISGQSLWMIGLTLAIIAGLWLFFGVTLLGKALRATAVNRLGARLMGIGPAMAGRLSFTVAAFIGALSGILVAPLTTIYYDTGFLIGLKGFVAAIIGGLASYPGAAAAAILVGLIESLSAFEASAYKEVIVFLAIIPVLLWRSARAAPVEDEE
ncbi:branched-chain amino acid ABC transporter permease [Methylobacterium nodulans]|uniref:Inner-membrane translocator n=1 Tax=Methylobacterium nodulans (strain LMG 21967 / CNCM I-2342 / ORS 2060) TaxID=460265 RepID=B8ILH4_METNO|nr:branched-chain amino acid ABC transporter permease [Methylobacterium nodulans]ACL60173.1 inner-membrane translocator [Methylobacterium nodulans ORS 2060]